MFDEFRGGVNVQGALPKACIVESAVPSGVSGVDCAVDSARYSIRASNTRARHKGHWADANPPVQSFARTAEYI